MFPSQRVYTKIVSPSNGLLNLCFPCKWYALKSFLPQMGKFIHASLAKCYALKSFFNQITHLSIFPSEIICLKSFPPAMAHFLLASLANGIYTPWNRFPLKLPTLSMFPSEMVRLKIVFPSNDALYPCFPCKWYILKLFPPQMAFFIHVSLGNGTS